MRIVINTFKSSIFMSKQNEDQWRCVGNSWNVFHPSVVLYLLRLWSYVNAFSVQINKLIHVAQNSNNDIIIIIIITRITIRYFLPESRKTLSLENGNTLIEVQWKCTPVALKANPAYYVWYRLFSIFFIKSFEFPG